MDEMIFALGTAVPEHKIQQEKQFHLLNCPESSIFG